QRPGGRLLDLSAEVGDRARYGSGAHLHASHAGHAVVDLQQDSFTANAAGLGLSRLEQQTARDQIAGDVRNRRWAEVEVRCDLSPRDGAAPVDLLEDLALVSGSHGIASAGRGSTVQPVPLSLI